MLDNDLISVIIPVYNVEKYIDKCIQSILNQTYKNIEIIVIDDGSPDRCGEICDKYAEENNNIFVYHTENKGVSSARNLGLSKAKGSYIIFADPDDYLEKDMYYELYTELKHNDADIAIGGYLKEDEFGNFIESKCDCKKLILNKKDLLRMVIGNKYFQGYPWNKLFSRKIIYTGDSYIKFPENIYFAEDLLFTVCCFINADKAVYINKPFYHYIQRKSGVVNSEYNDKKLTILDCYESLISIYNKVAPEYIEILICEYVKKNLLLIILMYKNKSDKPQILQKLTNNIKKHTKTVLKFKDTKLKVKAQVLLLLASPTLFKFFLNLKTYIKSYTNN